MPISIRGKWFWLSALLAIGCAEPLGRDQPSASTTGTQLRNAGDALGCETLAAEDLHAIGILSNGCVATLIGDNTIVTAAHCLAPPEEWGADGLHWMLNPEGDTLPGSPSYIVHRPEHCAPEQVYPIVRFVTFGRGPYDVALAQISPRVVGGSETYPSATPFTLEASDPPHEATTQIDLYGRGCTTFANTYDGLLRRARIPYTAAGSWVVDFNQRVFLAPELREVLEPHYPPHGDGMSSEEEMTFFENFGNTCWGDSGSPAIVAGSRRLIKVVSGGSASFDYWDPDYVPRLTEDFGSVALVHSGLADAGVENGIFQIRDRLATGAAPGNLEALDTMLKLALASGGFGPETDGGPVGPEDFSPSACCVDGADNFCLIGVDVAGCWMTGPGGYCDPNGDGSFDDADWARGHDQYQAQCGGGSSSPPEPGPKPEPEPEPSSCCVSGKDNFCLIGVAVSGCAMTQPGGYCDPNGDGSFDDADWARGYDDYQTACP